MKICICVNGRPHESGVTVTINNIVKALTLLHHNVDVITIFGKSKFRPVKKGFVKKSDKMLGSRPMLTFLISKRKNKKIENF